MLKKISRLCDVLATPATRAALFSPKPRSVASALLVSQLKSEGVAFRTILDGGANVGQFARAALQAFPDAVVHSFEPSPETVQVLRGNLGGSDRHVIHETALGRAKGTAEFHCNSDSQTSSILAIKSDTATHQGVRQVKTVTVPVVALDKFAESNPLLEPILLKLDLQGYELEALKGAAERLLPRCQYILVEAVFDDLYDGEPLFSEILQYLGAQQFDFARPLSFMRDGTGRIVQMDALFRRRVSSSRPAQTPVSLAERT